MTADAPATSAGGGLHLRGVSLALGGRPVLDRVTVDVERGETVALVGPSGSGKSSLLYCASGLLVPDSGAVLLDGTDLTRLAAGARTRVRRKHVGFVFQFAELVPELTLRDNIALPLELLGARRRDQLRRADELVEALGLTGRAAARPAEVSGGEAQRAAVARAVAHRPSIVLADEPTGALDSANAAVVVDALLDLVAADRATLLLVTHDPGVAGRLGRAVSMLDGRVVVGGR